MNVVTCLWTAVKILGCVFLIVLFVSLILDGLTREIQSLMLEKAKRKSMEAIINANEEEREQFLDFLNKVNEAQEKIANTKNEKKE